MNRMRLKNDRSMTAIAPVSGTGSAQTDIRGRPAPAAVFQPILKRTLVAAPEASSDMISR
jgi:hypothetical protein